MFTYLCLCLGSQTLPFRLEHKIEMNDTSEPLTFIMSDSNAWEYLLDPLKLLYGLSRKGIFIRITYPFETQEHVVYH